MDCSGTSLAERGSENVVSNAEEQVRSLSNEVRDIKIRVRQQEKVIANLKNQQQNINNRLRAEERYSRKDSLLIVNPPFDANRVQNVTSETLKFFQNYLVMKIKYDAIKAYHVVPSTVNNNIMPNVVSNAEEKVSLSNEVRDQKIRVRQQEKIIANLKNQQQNINNRLRAQERYSRKDN